MRFVFRADGNPQIGLGHVTRCMALANVLKRYGDVEFVSKPLSINVPFKIHSLPSGIENKKDMEYTRNILKKLSPEVVIVDHHDIDQEYLNGLKPFADLIVCIDDLKRELCADIVVNVNAFSLKMKYNCDNGKVFLGPRYALVERVTPRKKVNAVANKILVSMGGADVLNLTPKIISALRKLDGIKATVVLGPAFNNEENIHNAMDDDDRFSVVRTDNLPEIMLQHDIAVCGGGTTLYELAATGTPAIILCQAENQYINARELHNKTIISLGMGDNLSPVQITNAVKSIVKNYPLRKRLSSDGKALVDCRGPERVAKTIISELNSRNTYLLPATLQDAKSVWGWRNEKSSRESSFNTRFIPFEEHKKWYSEALADSRKKLFIIHNNRRKVGFVRIDFNDEAELNIAIDRKWRGLGYGSRAIVLACALTGNRRAIARIKPGNEASVRAFQRSGFRILSRNRKVITMRLI